MKSHTGSVPETLNRRPWTSTCILIAPKIIYTPLVSVTRLLVAVEPIPCTFLPCLELWCTKGEARELRGPVLPNRLRVAGLPLRRPLLVAKHHSHDNIISKSTANMALNTRSALNPRARPFFPASYACSDSECSETQQAARCCQHEAFDLLELPSEVRSVCKHTTCKPLPVAVLTPLLILQVLAKVLSFLNTTEDLFSCCLVNKQLLNAVREAGVQVSLTPAQQNMLSNPLHASKLDCLVMCIKKYFQGTERLSVSTLVAGHQHATCVFRVHTKAVAANLRSSSYQHQGMVNFHWTALASRTSHSVPCCCRCYRPQLMWFTY